MTNVKFFPSYSRASHSPILKTTLDWPSIAVTISQDRCLGLKTNSSHEGYVYVEPV